MSATRVRIFVLAAVLLILPDTPARAGVYADDFARCLVSSTTSRDRTDLVRWIFANAALHPEVSSMVSMTSAERAKLTQTIGQLLERLLTQACRKQLQDAVTYEGERTLELAFQVLGEVAMRGLMSDPVVQKGFGEIQAHFSPEKLKEVLPPKK